MKLLKLLRLFILRSVRQDLLMTLLSVIGVALGIGLFIGVKLASDRAVTAFENDIKGLNPRANYEILDLGGIDFDETVYADILGIEERSYPVISSHGALSGSGEAVTLTGIDSARSLGMLRDSADIGASLESFITVRNAVLVNQAFAKRKGVKAGDTIRLILYDREYGFTIVGLIRSPSLPPHVLIMDIGNFQEHLDRIGYLTRIDLVTDEQTAESIRSALPQSLSIMPKESLFAGQRSMVASFRYNLQFVSLIAILVGMFLLYNTVFISVVKRRTEIGILRGLGADRATVLLLFTAHGLLLGIIGSAAGIALGQVFAYFSVSAVQKTVSTMYSAISIADYRISFADAIRAMALGTFTSLAASLVPSYEAARIQPYETAREGSFEGRYRRYRPFVSAVGIFCVLTGLALSLFEYHYTPLDFPYLSYSAILLIILGFTCLSPHILVILLRLSRRQMARVFGAPARIAYGEISGSVYRFSIAVMTVAISGALIVALVTLIYSFRDSLKTWIRNTITADIYIKPASCTSNYCFQPLSGEIIEYIAGQPEVDGIDRYRALQVEVFGRRVVAGFGTTSLAVRLSGSQYFSKENEQRLRELVSSQQVAVSGYLATRHGLARGDTLDIPTPAGIKTFTVNDAFTSYSTTAGFVYLDRRWLKEFWGLDDATQVSLYLKPGSEAGTLIASLRTHFGGTYALDIMDNQELRGRVLAIFDRSFAITYAIEFIAILVSLIGVVNTLLALVLEKRRELSIFRYLGGSWRQVRDKLLLSGVVVAIAGIAIGHAMGGMMSALFIRVVNKISFGWEISFQYPLVYLVLISAGLFVTTLLASLVPLRVARRIDPKRLISFE